MIYTQAEKKILASRDFIFKSGTFASDPIYRPNTKGHDNKSVSRTQKPHKKIVLSLLRIFGLYIENKVYTFTS